MSKEIKTMCDIDVSVGTIFKIALESNVCSTGYSWALAYMPECVNLLDIIYESSNSLVFGTSVEQVFIFVAVKPCKDSIKFNLLRPWQPLNPAEQRVYPLTVCAPTKTEADELEDCMGKNRFVDTCSSATCYPTNLGARPYMAPFDYSCNSNTSPLLAMYMAISKDNVPDKNECIGLGCVKYAPPVIYKYATTVKYAPPIKPEDSCDNSSNNCE